MQLAITAINGRKCFQERGVFDKKTAVSFKENILSQGGTDHPMTLYRKFRGQEPTPDALLKRAGLIN
jgi:Zn-dependent oligopeptidase